MIYRTDNGVSVSFSYGLDDEIEDEPEPQSVLLDRFCKLFDLDWSVNICKCGRHICHLEDKEFKAATEAKAIAAAERYVTRAAKKLLADEWDFRGK